MRSSGDSLPPARRPAGRSRRRPRKRVPVPLVTPLEPVLLLPARISSRWLLAGPNGCFARGAAFAANAARSSRRARNARRRPIPCFFRARLRAGGCAARVPGGGWTPSGSRRRRAVQDVRGSNTSRERSAPYHAMVAANRYERRISEAGVSRVGARREWTPTSFEERRTHLERIP